MMRPQSVRHAALVCLALILPTLTAGASSVRVELLAEYDIPGGMRFEGTCVGGLSALYYDRDRERYYAVSDARDDARFYTLRLEIDSSGDKPRIARVDFEKVTRLLTREGLRYPADRVDPEGFALFDADSAFLSSEGVAVDGIPPFVDRIEVESGAWMGSAPLPPALRPRHDGRTQTQGVRNNLGLEALTLGPTRRYLYAGTESALAQDADDLGAGDVHFARLLRFEIIGGVPRLDEEVLYPLTLPDGDPVVHGLVELLAISPGHLLAIERTFSHSTGMTVKLFELRWSERLDLVDRSSLSPAARGLPVLAKLPVLDFGELPILVENFEGMTLGPRLADGTQTLVMLGDNDNTACAPPERLKDLRTSKFLLFALERPGS